MSQEQDNSSQEHKKAVIVRVDGLPFDNESGALSAMSQKGLNKDLYVIAKYGNGLGIFCKGEEPDIETNVKKEYERISMRDIKKLEEDYQEGINPAPKSKVSSESEPEKFYRVTFNDKSHPNDTDTIILGVNGEILNIRRGIEVIIPERFKIVADNARHLTFKQEPGKQRKVLGTVRTYGYMVHGMATRKDYNEFKSSGDTKTRAYLEQMEYSGDQEQS